MRAIFQDLRHAFRLLLKSRGFAGAAVVVLALGIGANSAIFSVLNAVLLRPLPFRDPGRLVEIYHVPPARSFPGIKRFAVSPANFLDWRALSHSFSAMAAYAPRQLTLTGSDRPETVEAAVVGADFFQVVQVKAQVGRVFSSEDDQAGHGNVAVISNGFWKSHFASNPDALGRKLIVNGEPVTIVGVAPAALHFAAWSPGAAGIWMPLAWDAQTSAIRNNHNFLVAARLNPGVTVEQAQAEMNTISNQLARQYPEDDRDWGAVVVSLREELVGQIRPVLFVLSGAVVFVLLIASANVANLIMARNIARRKEVALRIALGASRGRMLQQFLSESLLLALAGGALGLALATLATPLLAQYVNQQFELGGPISLDIPVLLFTLGITLGTGLLAGALPAWRGSHTDVNETLKQTAGRTASDAGARLTRSALVAAEVAFSMVLLVGAGLMVRSLALLTGVNPGFDPRNVLTLTAAVTTRQLPAAEQPLKASAFYRQLLDRVRALPGVESAGVIDRLPMRGGSIQPFTIEGRPAALFAQQPTAAVRGVSPGYLHTMRIPLLAGRDFTRFDTPDTPPAVLISESMARRFWPGENAIGKHLTLSFSPEKPREVVGVVGDVKQYGLDGGEPPVTLYESEDQRPRWPASLVVRSAQAPATLTGAVSGILHELDPQQPVREVRTMESILDESIADRRMSMILLAAFAGLALLLAAFGLYSVVSYTMRRRVREIGIRIALGASPRDVVRMAAADSLRPAAAGIAVGMAGAVLLTSLLKNLLFGIRPRDPVTFAAVAVTLGVAAIAASIVPAWRATRVDPLAVLREE